MHTHFRILTPGFIGGTSFVAGLRTRPDRGPSHPDRDSGIRFRRLITGLTAAGTVQVLHLVPFSKPWRALPRRLHRKLAQI